MTNARKLFRLALLCLLLAAVLLCSGCKKEAPQPVQEPKITAQEAVIGDVVSGFVLERTEPMPVLEAELSLWRHEETGAAVYFVKNTDPNRGFAMCFRTIPDGDDALPEILRNAICCSSEDYPGINVFEAADDFAYVTDMGTIGTTNATGYYAGSLSDDQLYNLAEYYIDCAFHSDIRSDENYFLNMAWRYHMTSPAAALQITGIVYNEAVTASRTLADAHYARTRQTLFPGTSQRFTNDPSAIVRLTNDDLVEYYDAVYHPGNSTFLLYGDVDMDRYLKLLNKELSKVEAQQPDVPDAQAPFEAPVDHTYDFPANQADNSGTMVSYNVVLPADLDFATRSALQTGVDCLNAPGSVLMQQLEATGIAQSYNVQWCDVGSQPMIRVIASRADASRKEQLRDTIFSALNTMAQEGVDDQLLQSFYDADRLEDTLARNTENIGTVLAQKLTRSVDTGCEGYLTCWAYSEEAQKLSKDGGLAQLLVRYINENPHGALVSSVPQPGALEEANAAMAQTLAALKDSMTDEERSEILSLTVDIPQWKKRLTPTNTINRMSLQLSQLEVPTIPVFETTAKESDGVRLYTAAVPGDAVSCQAIYDLSHLSVDQLRDYRVYLTLLGCSTESRSNYQVYLEKNALLRDFSAAISSELRADGTAYPTLEVSFCTSNDKLAEAVQLVNDMLLHTDVLTNTNSMIASIDSLLSSYHFAQQAVRSLALDAALSCSNTTSAVKYTAFNLNDHARLLTMRYADRPQTAQQLHQIRDLALTRQNMSLFICTSQENLAGAVSTLKQLMPEMTQAEPNEVWSTITLREPTAIGIKSTSSTAFALAFVDLKSLDLETTAELMLCVDALNDLYAVPILQPKMIASSAEVLLSESGIFMAQFLRAATFADAMQQLPGLSDEAVSKLSQLTRSSLVPCQFSAMTSMVRSGGLWNDAMQQLRYEQLGIFPAQRQELLQNIYDATPEDVLAATETLEEITDNVTWAVIAPAEKIDANAYLFNEILLLP